MPVGGPRQAWEGGRGGGVVRPGHTPATPAKSGGLLGGLLGGGARPTDDPTTSDSGGAGRGKGKGGDDANGGDKGQRSKR